MLRFETFAYLVLGLTLSAGADVAYYPFDEGDDGFVRIAGTGSVETEWSNPIVGSGSLRITLAENTHEIKVASPVFAVKPWTVYRIDLFQNADRGVQARVQIQLRSGEEWHDVNPTNADGIRLFASLPETTQARIVISLHVPGKSLGRSALFDEITVNGQSQIKPENGHNLYWDPSFEVNPNPASEFGFWATKPETAEASKESPKSGQSCLRIVAKENTYVVFPTSNVRSDHLYLFRCWVRGQGTIHPGLHKLAPSDWGSMRLDTSVRIGWSGPAVGSVTLKPDEWQMVEILTAAESDGVVWLQPYFGFREGTLYIDDMELRAIGEAR
jgi:hypothetical protein